MPAAKRAAAISNNRLISADAGTVAHRSKDSRIGTGNCQTVMWPATGVLSRHFLIDVPSNGLHRNRHFGLLPGTGRKISIATAGALPAA